MIFVRSTLTRTQREDEQQICYDMTISMKIHFKMSLIMNEKRCAQKQILSSARNSLAVRSIPPRNCLSFQSQA